MSAPAVEASQPSRANEATRRGELLWDAVSSQGPKASPGSMAAGLAAPIPHRPTTALLEGPQVAASSPLLNGAPPLPSPSPTPSMDDVLTRSLAFGGAGPSGERSSGKRRLFLCIDGGGTKTGVSIVERRAAKEGGEATIHLVARGSDRASNFSDRGLSAAIDSIGRATVRALESLPSSWPEDVRTWTYEQATAVRTRPAPFENVWAGLSGVNHGSDFAIMQRALEGLFGWKEGGATRLRVTNDCDLLASAIEIHRRQAGRIACEGGIVLIAGTGSVAMAFKPTPESDELASIGRGGGLGFLLGDEGSAYHIGKETLKAILNATDRGELDTSASDIACSTLTPLVLQHYGISTTSDLLGAIYALGGPQKVNEHDRKVRIAEVSRCTMACAYPSRTAALDEARKAGGDAFALRVLDASARYLSELVKDLAITHNIAPGKSVLSLGGGTWGYEAFKATVLEIMKKDWGAEWAWVDVVRDPDGTGAMALAMRAP